MIDLALLGAGRIGKVHAEAISTIGDVRLKYVFDPVEEAACSVIEQCGAVAAPLEHILDDRDIQGVPMIAPHQISTRSKRLSVLAGKAVFCEKPISTDLETTRHTLEVVERNEGMLMLIPKTL